MTVENKLESPRQFVTMSDVPKVIICPPLRCCEAVADAESVICRGVAKWQSPARPGELPSFYCAAHRRPHDQAIGGVVLFRRVTFAVQVVFAGTSRLPTVARSEAWAQLERAVANVGGLLNPIGADDVVCRYEAPQPDRRGRPRKGRGDVPPLTD